MCGILSVCLCLLYVGRDVDVMVYVGLYEYVEVGR